MTDTYPLDIEPWEQNISTLVNFAAKWKDMLPKIYHPHTCQTTLFLQSGSL